VAMGLVVFQADGRMMAVLCDGRSSLAAGEARQFMSYAGNYAFDGTTLSTRVTPPPTRAGRRRSGAPRPLRKRADGAGPATAALCRASCKRQELAWERNRALNRRMAARIGAWGIGNHCGPLRVSFWSEGNRTMATSNEPKHF